MKTMVEYRHPRHLIHSRGTATWWLNSNVRPHSEEVETGRTIYLRADEASDNQALTARADIGDDGLSRCSHSSAFPDSDEESLQRR